MNTSMNKKIKAIIIGYDIDKNHLKLSLKKIVKPKSCIKKTKKPKKIVIFAKRKYIKKKKIKKKKKAYSRFSIISF